MITSKVSGLSTLVFFASPNTKLNRPTEYVPHVSHTFELKPHSRRISPDSLETISILDSPKPINARHSMTDNSSETTSSHDNTGKSVDNAPPSDTVTSSRSSALSSTTFCADGANDSQLAKAASKSNSSASTSTSLFPQRI